MMMKCKEVRIMSEIIEKDVAYLLPVNLGSLNKKHYRPFPPELGDVFRCRYSFCILTYEYKDAFWECMSFNKDDVLLVLSNAVLHAHNSWGDYYTVNILNAKSNKMFSMSIVTFMDKQLYKMINDLSRGRIKRLRSQGWELV